jgi:alkanesulfonate monooxygenase SsuD/methylene tetrahydromethanopterin reductase-like flavin-dependent oxidoreductase (luciferase family)
VRLAEDLAALDLISEGRMDLTAGSASRTREFDTFGIEPAERFGRMWETLGIVRRALNGETFDHKGKYFDIPNLNLTTHPIQKPFPLWFGGFGTQSLRRAGRAGYHVQASLGEGEEEYYKGLAEGGHNRDDFNFAIRSGSISLITNQSEATEVQQRLDRALAAHNAEYNQVGRDLAFQFRNPEQETRSTDAARMPIAGTPDQILATLEPVLKDSRVTHLQLRTADFGVGMTSAGKWMDLFAKECLPVMQKWGREPVSAAVTV